MKDVRKDHARLLNNLVFLQQLYTAKAIALCIGVNPAELMADTDDERSIAE